MIFKKGMTIREVYGPAMEIVDPQEAYAYFEALVEFQLTTQTEDKSRAEIEKITRSNLGYFAGYYSHETRARVESLFLCEHPVFGAIGKNGAPTDEEAFQIGLDRGRRNKHGQ